MVYKETTALHKILKMRKRLRIAQGGARAGKSIAILLILLDMAGTRDNQIISVVSETIPHLKRGVMRDFLDIIKSQNYYKDSDWNKTDFIYTFSTGSIIEFFSADQPDKVRGPKHDILFINECNNVSYEVYTQLAIRTSKFIYLDYNPVSEFWVQTEILPTHTDYNLEILTYHDNELLAPEIIKELESRRHNKQFWKVYGEGLLGESEGRIFTGWQIIENIPHEARLERRGLDFGYSNDPTAIVDIYWYNGGFILDERLYRKGYSNKQIADFINTLEKDVLVMADSAEPKSIDEIHSFGINILGANKGPGSVNQGVQYVQDQKISVTKRSTNLLKEYRNYLWETDKDGHIINTPEKGWDHLLDAVRYGLETYKPNDVMEFPDDTKMFAGGSIY